MEWSKVKTSIEKSKGQDEGQRSSVDSRRNFLSVRPIFEGHYWPTQNEIPWKFRSLRVVFRQSLGIPTPCMMRGITNPKLTPRIRKALGYSRSGQKSHFFKNISPTWAFNTSNAVVRCCKYHDDFPPQIVQSFVDWAPETVHEFHSVSDKSRDILSKPLGIWPIFDIPASVEHPESNQDQIRLLRHSRWRDLTCLQTW